MSDYLAHITREIHDSIEAKNQLARSATAQIADAAAAILSSLQAGGKLIIFGNGGSASDAEHMVAELVGRYRVERRALPAIALTTNSSRLLRLPMIRVLNGFSSGSLKRWPRKAMQYWRFPPAEIRQMYCWPWRQRRDLALLELA